MASATELRPDSIFEHFYIHCKRDGACLDSLEQIGIHCRNQNENLTQLDMVCGECGETFTNLRKLTCHATKPGFKFRTSTIRNYSKDLFDPNRHFEVIQTAENQRELPTLSPIFPEISSKYFRNPPASNASLHLSTSTPLHQIFISQEHDAESTDTDLRFSNSIRPGVRIIHQISFHLHLERHIQYQPHHLQTNNQFVTHPLLCRLD